MVTIPPQPPGSHPPEPQAPYGQPGQVPAQPGQMPAQPGQVPAQPGQVPTQPGLGGYQAPPPGGYQGQPPPGGYQPPAAGTFVPPPPGGPPASPAPVVNRIPEDQPFVVRPSLRKRALLAGGILLVTLIPVGCLFGSVLVTALGEDTGLLAVVGGLGCVLLLAAIPVGLQLWLVSSGGPVLALSPQGMWIKTRPTRGQAIWLPWEGIAQISRRRWSFEKMLVVKPRDPRVENNLGAFTALDSSMLKLFYGSGFTATLNFADKPESEIIQAINHFSAGRCPINW